MSIFTFVTFLIVITNLSLGILIFTRNRKSYYNISFFLMALFLSLWLLSNYFVDIVTTKELALLLTKITNLSAYWAMTSFLFFAAYFPNNKGKKGTLFVVAPSIFMSILIFTDRVFTGVTKESWGYNPILGSLSYLQTAFYITLSLYALTLLARSFYQAKSVERRQMGYLLLGLFLTIMLVLFFSVIIYFFTDSASTAKYAPLTTLFFIGFTSYAIVRHRLMDIRMVVARSVAYLVLLLMLGGFYGAAIFAAQAFIFPEVSNSGGYVALQIVLAVIMAFTFQPLRKWITRVTDKVFFKNQYDPELFLDNFTHTIGSIIVLVELMFRTMELIKSEIKVARGLMVIFTDSGRIYNSQSFGYKEGIDPDPEDMQRLTKDGVLVYDELEERSRLKSLLRKYDAAIAVPIRTDKTTQGVLLLGEKLSGDMYSAKDLQVFEIVAPELAMAIINSKSYEKIERFNITLRQEVKKATNELERKNEQLRELDKAKDEFISMASHQLRTPLTAIKGYLSMLLEGDAGEIKVSQYDFVNEAFQGANRMVGLINDLLNVSRMETGRFFLEPAEVDLDRVVQEEMKQLSNHAKEKKLTLKYEKKGKIPKVWADETKIRQVVMNFMDNAIYYTTKGTVTIRLSADKVNVIYEVSDTGIGVPKSQQKNLFTKFYRADNARHVRPDGTGLGIYLAKKVVDDHGGELIFHSTEGKGSTFGFKFPLKSKLKTKMVSAPKPTGPQAGPALGELAAGIGVSAEALAATSLKPEEEKKAVAESLEASAEAKENSVAKIRT